MRLFMLRLLLLAVFFNTAIGMPVHSASHMRQAVGGAVLQGSEAQARAAYDGTSGKSSTEGKVEAAESVCVWCMGHAPHAAALLPYMGLPLAAAAPPERVPPRRSNAAIPAQNRWAFASRDPPR